MLEKFERLIILTLCPTLIFIWGAASIYFMYSGDAEMFQRMGALGVSTLIMTYGLLLHRTARVARSVSELTERVTRSHIKNSTERISALYDFVLFEVKEVWGRMIPTHAHDKPSGHRDIGNDLKREVELLSVYMLEIKELDLEFRREYQEIMENLKTASESTTEVHNSLNLGQLSFLILATLQWGFGDLLVSFTLLS